MQLLLRQLSLCPSRTSASCMLRSPCDLVSEWPGIPLFRLSCLSSPSSNCIRIPSLACAGSNMNIFVNIASPLPLNRPCKEARNTCSSSIASAPGEPTPSTKAWRWNSSTYSTRSQAASRAWNLSGFSPRRRSTCPCAFSTSLKSSCDARRAWESKRASNHRCLLDPPPSAASRRPVS